MDPNVQYETDKYIPKFPSVKPMEHPEIVKWLAKNQHKLSYPSAWYGNEPNTFQRQSEWDKVELRVGLGYVYPYTTCSQTLAIPSLYSLVNKHNPRYLAERFYFPTSKSDLKKFEKENVPMFSVESKRPWKDFDVIGVSVSFDIAYLNIIKAVHMSGMPMMAKDRTLEHPFLGIGGPTAVAPDTIAPILDWVYVGDAEEHFIKMLDIIKAGKVAKKSREDILFDVTTQVPCVYVPQFYQELYDPKTKKLAGWKKLRDGVPDKIMRAYVKDMDTMPLLTRPIVSYDGSSMGLGTVQVSRGCGFSSCRFSLAEGERVFTNRGNLPIEQVKAGDLVSLGDGTTSPVSAFIDEGSKEVIELRLENGLSITCTKDHRFAAYGTGDSATVASVTDANLKWVEAGNLTQGSQVLVTNKIGLFSQAEPEFKDLPTIEKGAPNEEKAGISKYPQAMSPKLAGLVGYFMGAGTNRDDMLRVARDQRHNNREKCEVSWSFPYSESVPEVFCLDALKDLFGATVNAKPSSWLGWGHAPFVYRSEIAVSSVNFVRFWKAAGLYMPSIFNRQVPEPIQTATKESQLSFLRMLFDAGARVTGSTFDDMGRPILQYVEYRSAAYGLLSDVQRMLLNFGISSELDSACRKPDGTWYHLRITLPSELVRFKDTIGFRITDKASFLDKLVETRRSETQSLSPLVKVLEVAPKGTARIFDITVPKGEYFIASGLYAHNCEVGNAGKPYREINLDRLIDGLKDARKHTGSDSVLALSFNLGEYSKRKEMTKRIVEEVCTKMNIASLRIQDACEKTFSELLGVAGIKSVAVGVEGTSQRVRDAVNKGCSNEDIVHGCENLMRAGLSRVKLYMISNMSQETEEDLMSLIELSHMLAQMKKRVSDEMKSYGKRPPKTNFLWSFTPFQAAPFTPMQFAAMAMDKKMVGGLRDKVKETGLKVKFGPKGYSDEYYVTQLLTRGDRRVFPGICEAVLNHDGYHFTYSAKGIRFVIESAIKKNYGIGFEMYFRGWDRGDVTPYDFIDIGITYDSLWEEYERYLMVLPGGGCNQTCISCGGCDPEDLKRRMKVRAQYLNEPDLDVTAIQIKQERGNVNKLRLQVWQDDSRRFVPAKYWKYAYRRSCFMSEIPVDDRGPYPISSEVKINNFVAGMDYVDILLHENVDALGMTPDSIKAMINKNLDGAQVRAARIVDGDQEYVTKLHDSCFSQLFMPFDLAKVQTALKAFEVLPIADAERIAYFNQDTSELDWDKDQRKAFTTAKKQFMAENPAVVQVKVPSPDTDYQLELLDLKVAVKDAWSVIRDGKIYLRMLSKGNATIYDLCKSLFGLRQKAFYGIPAVRIDYILKDAEGEGGDLDMFRPVCATCGRSIESNLFDESMGKTHCLVHQVDEDEFQK